MEKVSIIVPMYNVEKYVKKCLESLINQTYSNIEIYAVSDGSPDNSLQIAKDIAKKDKRIICIDKENGGYGSVLSETIKRIKTKYFLICDPDDWLENNAIEVLVNHAEKHNLDIVIADKYNVSIDDNIPKVIKSNSNYSFINITPNIVVKKDIEKFSFLYVSPHAKLYKTNITKDIVFPNKVSYTDFILYVLSLIKAKNVMYVNIPLAYYLLDRPGNSNTDRTMKSIKNHIIVWNSIFEQIPNDSEHCYIYNRLYFEFKMFLKSYSIYSINLFKDDLYNDLVDIHKKLLSKRRFIKKVNNSSIKRKIDYFLLLNKCISLKFFIKINKLINKW